MGADIGILSGRTESPYAVGDRIKSVLGPDGPSVVIDCAGFEATMQVRPPGMLSHSGSRASAFCARQGCLVLVVHTVLLPEPLCCWRIELHLCSALWRTWDALCAVACP